MKILSVAIVLIFIAVMYLTCFVVPEMEKEAVEAEVALTNIEILIIKASHFLQQFGVYIAVLLVAGAVYVFMSSSEETHE